jgi:hypothetical protein
MHSSSMGRVMSVSASLTDGKVLYVIELWLTALECVRASAHAISCASDLAHNLTLHLANAFRIYIYFFVQRPKGILPAYEGILLIEGCTTETSSASRTR